MCSTVFHCPLGLPRKQFLVGADWVFLHLGVQVASSPSHLIGDQGTACSLPLFPQNQTYPENKPQRDFSGQPLNVRPDSGKHGGWNATCIWTQFNFSATGSFNYCNCFSSPVTHFKCTSTDACWEPVTFGLGAGDTVMKTHSRFRGARNRHPFVVHTSVRTGSPWAAPGSGPEASASTEGGLILVPV